MRIIFLFSFVILIFSPTIAASEEQVVQWNETFPNFYVAKNQIWHSNYEDIHFDAIKIHLGYYSLRFVDIAEYARENRAALNSVNDNRKFSTTLLDVGVENLIRSYPDINAIAAVSAGWSSTLRKVDQVGLLRINGVDHSDLSDNVGMSAVVCLNSPSYANKGYDYQVPIFYKLDPSWEFRLIEKCQSALQVGPRIVEDVSKARMVAGIEEGEKRLRPQIRTFMIIDTPIRNSSIINKSRDNARNAYFVITTNPVHLFTVQNMILDSDFYGRLSSPEWAVNLVNGGPSGISLRDNHQSTFTTFGNPSGVFGSAILISRR